MPPPRAALPIHKFSVGSAATELQSQPGEPCICRPPSRRPWAARPGAEVGAAGPGVRGRAGTGGRMRVARGWRPAPGPTLAHRSCRARLRGGSRAWERPEPPCTPPTARSLERDHAHACPWPQFTLVRGRERCRLGLLDPHEPGIGFSALSLTVSCLGAGGAGGRSVGTPCLGSHSRWSS